MSRAAREEITVEVPGGPPVRRLTANNPSPMTGAGTNSFIIGDEALAIIDPGPIDEAHFEALTQAAAGKPVFGIFVTHSHIDHSPLARPLAERLDAPILAFGRHEAGRSETMERLAQQGVGGGEGADRDFSPDELLEDGDPVASPEGGWRLTARHTPGHIANHLSFALERPGEAGAWRSAALFCGDHVMDWSSSLVSPPDGDMGAYMRSLEALAAEPDPLYLSAHGETIEDPAARLAELIKHRRGREASVLAALEQGPADAGALARLIYTEIPAKMLPLAERNVLAHLIDLWEQERLSLEDEAISTAARFRLG